MRVTLTCVAAAAGLTHLCQARAFNQISLLDPTTKDSNGTWTGVTNGMIASAIDAMNTAWYNETDGRWNSTTAWWLTGNALQGVCDYMLKTGDTQYLSQAEGTIEKQSGPLPWWPEGGGDFRADSTDDTGWWALALVRLFDITDDSSYLDTAELDEEYIYSYWNTSTCGGGILWNIPDLSYKNAISNELYIKLAASLHNRKPGDTQYLQRALQVWNWFNASGMINSADLVNDGLAEGSNGTCTNNGGTTWTYNQGVVLGGLSELYLATGDKDYLNTAKEIADAVVSSAALSPNGILTEPCEPTGDCDSNQETFKGIFSRNLGELNILLADRPYDSYLAHNARSAWENDRNSSDYYGLSWAGPYTDATVGTQSSVISLLVSNIW
ncbi:hypothetical protein VM1G_10334 [Cytospora mali]|uniref:Mannan endo-1,6-alpha-mannosidase DFG5 n=1 Tax=Cytospora mali TaxID=578113 RepID=A0A194VH62_CYTMA|nr:hypothetical protein VM1G_10334 [Valsa mali]